MHAPRQRQTDPALSEGFLRVTDFLYIGLTVTFIVLVFKFFLTHSAEEIVHYFEDEKNHLLLATVIISMSVIVCYTAFFYVRKRYEVMVDLALEWLNSGRNNVLHVRSSFSWLRNLLAVIQPPPGACKLVHTAFRHLFKLGMLVLVSFTGAYLCTGGEIEFLCMNFVVLGLYFTLAFWQDVYTIERVLAHLGYSLLHAGTLLSYCDYNEVSYICINSGVAVFILCIVWYFVNVPAKRETSRRRRRH